MKFMTDMDWPSEGWTLTTVTVVNRFNPVEAPRMAWEHADAPGLCIAEVESDVSITHKPTGLRAVTFYRDPDYPVCPRFLREVLTQACQIIDYASLTLDTCTKVPEEDRRKVSALFEGLYDHTDCPVCRNWSDAQLPQRIADAEEEVQDWELELVARRRAVEDAEYERDFAESELRKAKAELGRLKAKEQAHGRG